MIKYHEAIDILSVHARTFETYLVDITEAVGKISAENYFSDRLIPSFRNSAMDGFAICSDSIPSDFEIDVKDSLAAGDDKKVTNTQYAYEITTGAIVPDICDSVIPIEDVIILQATNEQPERIRLNISPVKGGNIRSPGEDFKPGDVLLKKGQAITPENIMALAAHGIAGIHAYNIPPIHIIATGNEIIEAGKENIAHGKIYNSNSPYLISCIRSLNIDVTYHGIITDDLNAFVAVLESIPPNAIIITTGAVSMGRWDLIPAAVKKMDGNIHFHKVQIRPGKPVLFASLPNNRTLFGLPGNPISTVIGFRFFVVPFLRLRLGMETEKPKLAKATTPYTKKNKMKQFLKASYDEALSSVDILGGQESFKISPLLHSNIWAVLDEETSEIKTGDILSIYPFKPSLSNSYNLEKEKENERAA